MNEVKQYNAPPRADTPVFTAGLDLGLALNNSHLVICQLTREPTGEYIERNVWAPLTTMDTYPTKISEPKLELNFTLAGAFPWPLNTPYRQVIDEIADLLTKPPFENSTQLRFDQTGVGNAVSEFINEHNRVRRFGRYPAYGIVSTGGNKESRGNVPKKSLLLNLQGIIQSGRFRIPRKTSGAKELAKQLEGMRAKISAAGNPVFESDEAEDAVDALAMACWHEGLETLKPPIIEDYADIPKPGSKEAYDQLRRIRRESGRKAEYHSGITWL